MGTKEKFSSQMDSELLAKAHQISKEEGKHFQAIVEEGIKKVIENREAKKVRPEVMAHFQASLQKNYDLYRLLAQ